MATRTLFERLMAGELPCHVVYQDAHVFAFLDIAPLSDGHTLLVPREAVARLDALSEQSAAAIGRVLPMLCRAVMHASGAQDYNVLQNNGASAHQAVPHVHFHIIPKHNAQNGLPIAWPSQTLSEARAAALVHAMADKLPTPARP